MTVIHRAAQGWPSSRPERCWGGSFRLRLGGEIETAIPPAPYRSPSSTSIIGTSSGRRQAPSAHTVGCTRVVRYAPAMTTPPYPAGTPGPGRGRPAQRRRRAGRQHGVRSLTLAGVGDLATAAASPPLRLEQALLERRAGHETRFVPVARTAARPGPPPAADRRLRQRSRGAGRPEPCFPAVVGRGGHGVRTGSDLPRAGRRLPRRPAQRRQAGIADGTIRPDASPARSRSRSSGNSAASGCSGCSTRRPSTSNGCTAPSPSTGAAH